MVLLFDVFVMSVYRSCIGYTCQCLYVFMYTLTWLSLSLMRSWYVVGMVMHGN